VPITIGSRVFAPGLWPSLLTAALLVLLLSLGRWQLHRADEKRALYDAFAAGTGSAQRIDASSGPLERYRMVEATGHYDPTAQILIDNMIGADGRAGYYVITPFTMSDGASILVNRGWIPLGASRAELPAIDVPTSERHLRARVDQLPRPGIRMGQPQPLMPPFPIRAAFPSLSDIQASVSKRPWSRSAEVLLLDPHEPDGYRREWAAPGFPPMRHIAYAVQWFGLALALSVIYIVSNLKS
jgi:surfeit locus 1 family protein